VAEAAKHARIAEGELGAFAGQVEGVFRNLDFGAVGVASEVSNLGPIGLAGLEIHRRIRAGRILVQSGVDYNEGLDDPRPIGVGDSSEALEQGRKLRWAGCVVTAQCRLGFGEHGFKKAEAKESGEVPQLEDGKGIVRLQSADKGRQRGLGQIASDGPQIQSGKTDNPGFVLALGQ